MKCCPAGAAARRLWCRTGGLQDGLDEPLRPAPWYQCGLGAEQRSGRCASTVFPVPRARSLAAANRNELIITIGLGWGGSMPEWGAQQAASPMRGQLQGSREPRPTQTVALLSHSSVPFEHSHRPPLPRSPAQAPPRTPLRSPPGLIPAAASPSWWLLEPAAGAPRRAVAPRGDA